VWFIVFPSGGKIVSQKNEGSEIRQLQLRV